MHKRKATHSHDSISDSNVAYDPELYAKLKKMQGMTVEESMKTI
jgi:hypothetical protein